MNRSPEDNIKRDRRSHVIAIVVALVLLVATLVAMAAKANAVEHTSTDLCVSRFEWRHLRALVGEPVDLAAPYLDGPGTRRAWADEHAVYHYARCDRTWGGGRVVVHLDDERTIVAVFRDWYLTGADL